MAKRKSLEEELAHLLSLGASFDEAERLKEAGVCVKKPTKLTVLAFALFEKGAKGDLSAIKEIAARLGSEPSENGGVILIDDVGNTDK